MKVALCFNHKHNEELRGGIEANDWNVEYDSDHTIQAVADALRRRFEVVLIEADRDCFNKFIQEKPDLVFNMAEGFGGAFREAYVPTILEMLGIPYTGSDPLTLGICLDKWRTKELLNHYGLATPAAVLIEPQGEIPQDVPIPAIVKPVHEGSSKGITNNSVVESYEELKKLVRSAIESYRQAVIVEEYLPGREFTIALMGNEVLQVFPVVEIFFDNLPEGAKPIYGYEAKWVWDNPQNHIEVFKCPAPISDELRLKMEEMCKKAYRIFRCRDWCRIDLRLNSGGEPMILELNPLPGIGPREEDSSCYPTAVKASGMTYEEMILKVVDLCLERIRKQNAKEIPYSYSV